MDATKVMDLKGLKCPMPTLKMTTVVHNTLNRGTFLRLWLTVPLLKMM